MFKVILPKLLKRFNVKHWSGQVGVWSWRINFPFTVHTKVIFPRSMQNPDYQRFSWLKDNIKIHSQFIQTFNWWINKKVKQPFIIHANLTHSFIYCKLMNIQQCMTISINGNSLISILKTTNNLHNHIVIS